MSDCSGWSVPEGTVMHPRSSRRLCTIISFIFLVRFRVHLDWIEFAALVGLVYISHYLTMVWLE